MRESTTAVLHWDRRARIHRVPLAAGRRAAGVKVEVERRVECRVSEPRSVGFILTEQSHEALTGHLKGLWHNTLKKELATVLFLSLFFLQQHKSFFIFFSIFFFFCSFCSNLHFLTSKCFGWSYEIILKRGTWTCHRFILLYIFFKQHKRVFCFFLILFLLFILLKLTLFNFKVFWLIFLCGG